MDQGRHLFYLGLSLDAKSSSSFPALSPAPIWEAFEEVFRIFPGTSMVAEGASLT